LDGSFFEWPLEISIETLKVLNVIKNCSVATVATKNSEPFYFFWQRRNAKKLYTTGLKEEVGNFIFVS
jgi:hypothetical protein